MQIYFLIDFCIYIYIYRERERGLEKIIIKIDKDIILINAVQNR